MYSDNAFRFSVRRFLVLMLPTCLRKKKLVNFFFCLVSPLQTLKQRFNNRRSNALMRAKYDSGKGNMERMLNILYNGAYASDNKPIYIENGSDDVENMDSFVYEPSGLKKLDSIIVSDTNEDDRSFLNAEKSQVAFTIYIPSRLAFQESAIRDRALMFILPGMSFTTKIYSE